MIHDVPKRGAGGAEGSFHASSSSCGVLYELCEEKSGGRNNMDIYEKINDLYDRKGKIEIRWRR